MSDDEETFTRCDLYKQYDANTIEVEHRYFGKSLPEPIEDVNYTYLATSQKKT